MLQIHIKHPINTAKGLLDLEFKSFLEKGAVHAIFGESGAGKTTLLKIIAGLITPHFGYLKVENEVWIDTTKKINLAPQKRRIGFVFQDYALFPNMNIRSQLSYVTKNVKRIDELLELMGLRELEKAFPRELSGGQAQRVALARALAREPQLLLLDEPLSALDFKMRSFLQDELEKIFKHFKITTLLVSHDLSEIYKLSSRIIELQNGIVVKNSLTKDFFHSNNLSAKLCLNATVLEIQKNDIIFIITLMVGKEMIKITVSENEFEEKYKTLKSGDTLIIAIKAFNPMIVTI
ncbi:ATP-binding cassette domain-containing protein [Campylobacter sp. MIT 21-1685]|uniref:ATP-binding cassette domain-containing protein n=1 Tax=unclassified Campylobacter TaxID=2593542 RepID=UPI00224A9030|nr:MULTISPECIES: ATP-binding cassette domain-containing protein [unclassified Campylobacter]MCX2683049.1 ATP-binding cassette domain-containing protein [Campylobacter sp. MIT 21-1684]MCX2751331.1 ATP-binding cassette domain-containing protein [Campylobacter sp. MIT 21-1682]MCX2807530.1 ATP-binding cassette domain-containing protein [Campylobacter sp. MIT 21-1685]